MKAASFKRWLKRLPGLTRPQRAQVLQALRPAVGLDRVVEAIAQARAARRCCPACASKRCHRHGHADGLQRYRCRQCGRTFNDLTGTPLARLRHRAKWPDYLDTMLDSKSVRAAAKAVNVHRNTSFRWRHRVLHLAKLDRPSSLKGIAEADEMFLLESQKGSRTLDRPARKRGGVARRRGISRELDCILVARDRTGQTVDYVTGRGPVTTRQLHQHLRPVLDPEVLLVTDPHAAYRAFAREAGIAHHAVNLRAGERLRGAIHVQNVNAYHGAFANGWRASTGSRRATCPTISAGNGCWTAGASVQQSNFSGPRSDSSICNGDSAFFLAQFNLCRVN